MASVRIPFSLPSEGLLKTIMSPEDMARMSTEANLRLYDNKDGPASTVDDAIVYLISCRAALVSLWLQLQTLENDFRKTYSQMVESRDGMQFKSKHLLDQVVGRDFVFQDQLFNNFPIQDRSKLGGLPNELWMKIIRYLDNEWRDTGKKCFMDLGHFKVSKDTTKDTVGAGALMMTCKTMASFGNSLKAKKYQGFDAIKGWDTSELQVCDCCQVKLTVVNKKYWKLARKSCLEWMKDSPEDNFEEGEQVNRFDCFVSTWCNESYRWPGLRICPACCFQLDWVCHQLNTDTDLLQAHKRKQTEVAKLQDDVAKLAKPLTKANCHEQGEDEDLEPNDPYSQRWYQHPDHRHIRIPQDPSASEDESDEDEDEDEDGDSEENSGTGSEDTATTEQKIDDEFEQWWDEDETNGSSKERDDSVPMKWRGELKWVPRGWKDRKTWDDGDGDPNDFLMMQEDNIFDSEWATGEEESKASDVEGGDDDAVSGKEAASGSEKGDDAN